MIINLETTIQVVNQEQAQVTNLMLLNETTNAETGITFSKYCLYSRMTTILNNQFSEDLIGLVIKVQRDTGRDFMMKVIDQTIQQAVIIRIKGLLVSFL